MKRQKAGDRFFLLPFALTVSAMLEWDDYWQQYTVSKAESYLISERDAVINTCLDRIDAPRKAILEVGCGYGSNIRAIQARRSDVECYALDNSEIAIEQIREEIPNALLGDCRKTPFPKGTFDVIFSGGLMEHFRDETPFLREMKRILKEDGYLITFVPARFSLWKLYQALHFGFWQHGYERSYTYSRLKTLLSREFQVVEVFGIDPFSINGFIMKLFDIRISPIVRRSFLRSGYAEFCVVSVPAP